MALLPSLLADTYRRSSEQALAVAANSMNSARSLYVSGIDDYDELRRFDLADTAYSKVLQLASTNAAILNNAGYSKMLRGDYKSARIFLMKAYDLDPNNPYINNNIALLGESQKSIKRAAL